MAGNLTNHGVVAPGNSLGAINTGGKYTLLDSSVYHVEINGYGESDFININGTAVLAWKVLLLTSIGQSGFRINHAYKILTAAGGLNGSAYNGRISWNDTPTYWFVEPQLTYDENNVYLSLIRNDVPIVIPDQNPNEQAVGRAIDHNGQTSALKNGLL